MSGRSVPAARTVAVLYTNFTHVVVRGDSGIERIADLRVHADELIVKIAKDPALRKLQKMRELRDELDERRKYALTAIFNTTHYPYPADKGSKQYQADQLAAMADN